MGPKFLISAPLIVTFLLNGKLGRRSACGGKGKRKGSRMERRVTKEQSILAQKFSNNKKNLFFTNSEFGKLLKDLLFWKWQRVLAYNTNECKLRMLSFPRLIIRSLDS